MKKPRLLVIGALAGLALAGSAVAALQDENLLLPLPAGFKLANHAENASNLLSEFVPNGETVDHWSKMITERILRGNTVADPETAQSKMLTDWKGACPGADGHPISSVTENGYRVSYWSFNCPLNPMTNQSEFMVRKVIVGADALYDVQYAYRKQAAAELTQAALAYLRSVVVCDTRARDHPCPSGLTPAAGAGDAAPNPVAAFLRAADGNDFAAMGAMLDPGSAGFLKKIGGCYLRRVYANDQQHELLAAWMCAEGPNRSRVIIGDIAVVSGGRIAIAVRLDTVNDRPAPARTGSAFAN